MDRWRTVRSPTHYSMVGGMLKVPEEETAQFFARYVEEVITGKLYLVEKITPRFKFFLDLDWVGPEPDYRDVLRRVNEVVPGRVEMAVTPVKMDNKYGMHIHWPDLVVDKARALELREQLPIDIRKFADSSVYNTGLRMLWSHKKDGSLPYVPLGRPKPDVQMLRLFSIRAHGATRAVPTTERAPVLDEFIRKYIPGQSNLTVKHIKKNRIETDSRYCERIRREHRSNHVYFVIEGDKIRQRCFDEDCKGFEGKIYKLSPVVVDALKSAARADAGGDFLDDD